MTTPPLTEEELDKLEIAAHHNYPCFVPIHQDVIYRLIAAARAHLSAGEWRETKLDQAWSAINALGGVYDAADLSAGGYSMAIDAALREIEKLGGRDPLDRPPIEAIAEEGEIDHVHGIPYRVGSIKHKPAAPLCTCTPQFGQDPYCPEHSHYDPQPIEAVAEESELMDDARQPGGPLSRVPRSDAIAEKEHKHQLKREVYTGLGRYPHLDPGPLPRTEAQEGKERCPCGSSPFAFNFEPGDGEITCAWCGRNMN